MAMAAVLHMGTFSISSQLSFSSTRLPPCPPSPPLALKFHRRSSFPVLVSNSISSVPARDTNLNQELEKSISEAKEICAGNDGSEECAVAWDEVEEISAAVADKRVNAKPSSDPLEAYCKEHPETDECRVYED